MGDLQKYGFVVCGVLYWGPLMHGNDEVGSTFGF